MGFCFANKEKQDFCSLASGGSERGLGRVEERLAFYTSKPRVKTPISVP